ncbi:hypothetical protein [Brevibacterium antiquum]|uniref:Membrane domain of glycerophosphoryl diester phosphodiesterase n=1 Tax=Brevibacterium antiquum CNRZ 918 TaxID=1255637 RepID=A0A2H1JNJ5_9MICO|nr:hypothetical protein [Brevibacterium antiquum]SMX88991.1 hypothetical protein BANT918_01713 [Brevibacterium antiquum CNRZ 918]
MGRSNAWTSEVDWQTGQWQRRDQGPTHHEWHPPSPRGVLAKRPLTFFEVLDSGFRLLRFVPGLTIGAALIVFTLWTLVLTAVGTFAVLEFLPFLNDLVSNDDAMSGFFLLAQMGSFAISLLSLGVAHFLAGLAASGAESSFGARKTTLTHSWRSLHGRRWSLILTALLLGAINLGLLILLGLPSLLFALFDNTGLAIVTAFLALGLWLCALIWLNLRFAFTGSAIAVERLGVRAALRRSWKLTGSGFWRTFGQLGLGYFLSTQLVQLIITPLVTVVTVVATIAIGTAAAGSSSTTVILVIAGAILLLLTTVSSAILFAYFSCLVCVCYFDQRMRSEGFDLVLIRREEGTA